MERVALVPTSGLVPRLVAPSKKVTVPVGLPIPVATETVAVNWTGAANGAGLRLLTTTVEVVPLLTTWVRLPVLPVKLASPL